MGELSVMSHYFVTEVWGGSSTKWTLLAEVKIKIMRLSFYLKSYQDPEYRKLPLISPS